MKEGWKVVKLGEVCEIYGRIGYRGYTKKDLVANQNEGAITLSPTNIVNYKLDLSNCTYISWEKYYESPEIQIKEEDVVLVKTASIGKCAIIKNLQHEMTLNPQFVVLKNIKTNHDFLYYYLQTPAAQLKFQEFAIGTAIPTFSQKKLETLEIPAPPLSEQQRIVRLLAAAFEKIDALKANAEKNLANAKALFQQVLAKELEPKEGWEEKKLGDLGIGKMSYGSATPAKEYDNKVRYVRITDIDDTGNLHDDYKSPNIIDKKYLLEEGDLLFARTGATVGKTYLYKEEDGTCLYAGYLIRLRINKSIIHPQYLFYCTKTSNYWDFIKKSQRVAAQPNINAEQYSNYTIIYPTDIKEQQRIVATLDALSAKCRHLEEIVQKTIAECDALKQSILRQAFNGEL